MVSPRSAVAVLVLAAACSSSTPAGPEEAPAGVPAAPAGAQTPAAAATPARAAIAPPTSAPAALPPATPDDPATPADPAMPADPGEGPTDEEPPTPETGDTGVTGSLPEADPAPPEIAIHAWSSAAWSPRWTLREEPERSVEFVLDLYAGVLGRAGDDWMQLGPDGKLAKIELDRAPKLPVVGTWPADAWFVDERFVKGMGAEEADEYQEIRLMRLRGGKRWVPQVAPCASGGEQWFHPGTDDWFETRASTLSGMLVYNSESYTDICRVQGRHGDPTLGAHRGRIVEVLETGKREVYLVTIDDDGYYAVTDCEDEDCVRTNTRKLPLRGWRFGARVARGKHAASMIATHGSESGQKREFILHFRGKAGWLLDELPAGERPDGIWASEEGGLWTLTAGALRWRDTESAWHDAALPDGLQAPTVAMSPDGMQVWLSGTVGGAAKIFSTDANEVSAATPAPEAQ